jgi:hypothetical protein
VVIAALISVIALETKVPEPAPPYHHEVKRTNSLLIIMKAGSPESPGIISS